MLIEAGAPLDATRRGDLTALGWAERFGHRVAVEVLREHGATLRGLPDYTMDELFDGVTAGTIEPYELDERLWELVALGPQSVHAVGMLGRPILVAWASRYLELQVGNGGFAQAAFNMLDWFPTAAEAFDELGCPEVAAVVRDAHELAVARGAGSEPKRGPLSALLRVFQRELRESDLHPFDERAKDAGLYDRAFDARIAYLLAHRAEIFRALPEIERRAELRSSSLLPGRTPSADDEDHDEEEQDD